MIGINMFKAVRNISYIDKYIIKYVPTGFVFLMYEWTVCG